MSPFLAAKLVVFLHDLCYDYGKSVFLFNIQLYSTMLHVCFKDALRMPFKDIPNSDPGCNKDALIIIQEGERVHSDRTEKQVYSPLSKQIPGLPEHAKSV